MSSVADALHVKFPEDTAIDAEIDLIKDGKEYLLQARLNISLPGMDKATAQNVIELAQRTCPYSKAVHGNINVEYNLV